MNARGTPLSDDVEQIDGEILSPISNDMAPAIAAEINQQVATARKYPRRRDKEISDEIMGRAVLNPEIAAECMYTLPRGGKSITGPSIRFAEIVRASYGNMRVAARFVRLDLDDRERGAVIVEAAAMDLQSNTAECIPVRRSVMTSGKAGRRAQVFSADMINMTVNAASSLARRNAILAVVPKSLWIEGYQRVIKVLQGDAKTLGARRQEVIDGFGRVGVTPERVFEALGVKSIEDITIEYMPQLMGYVSRIRDGEAPDAVFGRAESGPQHATVDNPLKDEADDGPVRQPDPAKRAAQVADAQEAGASTETGELPASGDGKPTGEVAAADGPKAQATAASAPAATVAKGAPVAKPAEVKTKAQDGAARAHAEDLAAIATPTDYREYALAWIKEATDAPTARARWTAERMKRSELDLAEDLLVEISGTYQAKIRSLGPAT